LGELEKIEISRQLEGGYHLSCIRTLNIHNESH